MFIYLDESGSLTPAKNQQYFVLAALLVKDERIPKKLIRRAKEQGLPRKLQRLTEIKIGKKLNRYRELLFRYLVAEDVRIGFLVVDTKLTPEHLRREEGLLYLRLSKILLERCGVDKYDHLDITFDKRDLRGITKVVFNNSLKERFALSPKPKRFAVYHNDSTEVAGLRLVHHLAWATFQKYQRSNPYWCELFSPKIVFEEFVDFLS